MTHEEIGQEQQAIKPLINKYINNMNNNDYRELILEVVKERGGVGITALKQTLIGSKIDIVPFNIAILKIIGELTGLEEN